MEVVVNRMSFELGFVQFRMERKERRNKKLMSIVSLNREAEKINK